MKQETGKKKMKWLIPVIIVALLLIGGGAAWFMLSGNDGGEATQPQETTAPSTSATEEVMGRADIYWNLDRKAFIDPATSLSIREPAEDGLYHIRFAFDGEQVELTVADKKLVNRIDMLDFMGLEVDDSGNVTNCIAPGEICVIAAENFFVQEQTSEYVKVNSSGALNGMEIDYAITENTGIYNVSSLAEVPGAEDTVQPMDKVVVLQDGAGETTHIFIVERPVESYVYWRVGRYYANKETTRVPDENGVYHILFAVNGEQVTLPCKDKEIVTKIDAVDNNIQAMGLVFDDEGYIIDTMTSAMAVRGALVSNQFDVIEVSGTFFKTQRMLPSSNQGATWEGVMSETCKIYEVSGVADFIGQEVAELKVTDRVYVLTNTAGEAEIIYITNRMVDADLYWLATRQYDNAAQTTTLKPASDGYYYMEFVVHGNLVTLRSNDLEIVNKIQAPTLKAMGLELDGDVITKVYHYVNITGGWVVGNYTFVDAVNGPIVNTSSTSGSTTTFVMSADCEVMNVCFESPKVMGEYTTLQVGDRVVPLRNAAGEVVVIYVNLRKVDAPVYWNITRQYSSTKKETTRKPLTAGDWEGYYAFKVTTDGNRPTTVYTKSKALATKLDSKSPQAVGLKLSGKVITEVYGAGACTGGGNMANYCHVEYWENEEPDADGISRFYAKYRATGNGTTVKFNENTRIFNVSGAASYVGVEEGQVRLDDRITVFTNRQGIAEIIYIVDRTVYGEPYYNMQQKYNSSLQETTRKPNEEGYYVFDKIVHKGELITVKTKSKDVATEVDSYGIGMGMHVYNGIVSRAFSVASLAGYGSNIGPNFDITAIDGRQITLTRMRPSASNQGDTAKVTITSSCKFYDVSPYAEKPGAAVTPQVGDRVVIYRDDDNKYGAIGFITMRHNREGGAYGYCDHCDQEVYWNHWEGSFPANANKEKGNDTLHYFMAADRKIAKQIIVGNKEQTVMHAVLDLNGKTLESSQRTLMSWYGATVYVTDSSKDQTGTVIGAGDPSNKDSAGVAFTSRGGNITIYGGNWKVADEHYTIASGGIVNSFAHKDYAGGTITINGGKFYGTDVTANGGAVSCNTGEIIINGGEFFGGEAGNIGGTVHSNDKLTINGGIIHGGKANYGATVAVPQLFVNGGTIEKGEASKLGDCMYISSVYKATITGGTIEDIWVNSTWNQEKGFVKISGTPTIKNMDIAAGKLIDFTGLTGGSITVNASGVFTTEFATDAAAQAALKYFTSASDMATVGVQGKQLAMGVYRCLYGHTAEDHKTVDCDSEILTWSLWTNAGALPSKTGNYILTKDVTTANQTSISGENVILDLNGFDVTYKIPTARTQNFRLYYINDNLNKNGKEAGTTHGSLIITDNSSDDVTKQGTVKSILPAYAANNADEPKWKAEADEAVVKALQEEAKTAALLKGEEGSDAYKAEYEAQYNALYAAKYETMVAEYIKNLLESYKNTHEAGASGMLVHVAHGNFTLMGGNLDASNLTIKATGTAIATGTRLETMNADAQNVTILGGTVSGGTTTRSGGTISVATGTTLTMQGGTVNGGTLNGEAAHGAAIFGSGTMTISGGTVNGGTGATNSGSIYAEGNAAVVTIDGTAVVNAGTATNGDNVYIRFGTWTIGGKAKINGGVAISKASLTVTGAPTIVKAANGSEYSLKLVTKDQLVTFKDLEDGAKIAITGLGKFSTEGDDAVMQQWINKGYFVAEAEGKAIVIQGHALSVADADAVDKVYCVYGHLNHDGIECSEPLLTWSKWEDTTALPGAAGNYYLADNSTLTTVKNLNVMTTEDVQINLDLRGSTVLAPNGENLRLLLLRASNDSCYTITDTLAGGTIKTTATKLGKSMNGDLFFAYNGMIRVINVTLDASSIVENANQGSAVYVENYNNYIGSFMAEGCTVIGGNAKHGEAIAAGTGCVVILKDTTVNGGYYQNASAKNVQLIGDTKLLPGTYATYGVTGSVAAATFQCQNLGANAEIVAANCVYAFADEAAAQAAVANGNIKPAEGFLLVVEGANVKVAQKPETYCVYGHTSHEGIDCAEELLTWVKWNETNSLPTEEGNYILTGDVTVASQTNVKGVKIAIDLNGFDITYKIPAARRSTFSIFNVTDTEGDAKVVDGETNAPGALIITDTSSTDVAQQGVLKSVLPAYVPSDGDVTKAKADAAAYATEQGLTEGSTEYEAAVTAKYDELIKALQEQHEKGAAGMMVCVNFGSYRQVRGNLDTTNLKTGATGQAIFVAGGQSATIEGGTVSGGELYNNAHGAAISANGTLVVTGNAVINGGVGATNSGAIYAGNANANITINGNAVVNPGKATNGDAMYVRFGTWTIGGKATINGGVAVAQASLTVTGAPTILKQEGGSEYSLKLIHAKTPITFADLEAGAKIGITPAGVNPISTVEPQLQSWLDAGYFVCEHNELTLGVDNGALSASTYYCVYGHKTHEGIDCAEPIVAWTEWTGNKLPNVSGNYFLTEGTEYHVSSQGGATDGQFYDIKIDLRGNTVIQDSDQRLAILKATADSQYIITDTVGGAVLKTSKTESNINGGTAMLYANIGTIRVIGVEIDSTSITTNAQPNSVAVALATGKLIFEDCVIKGGASSNGIAVYHNPHADANVQNLVIKDTTIEGGVWVNGSALRVKLEGVVKLLPGNGTFGLKGSAAAAEFKCLDLADGSKIVAANCNYAFADAAAAQAAIDNGVIVPVEGMVATVDGVRVEIGENVVEKTVYCIYGHETHEGIDCAEPILTWTKWEGTTKLPETAGNYYVPAGSTITTTTNLNVMSTEAVQINLDLRGSTVLAPNKTNARLLLVRVANGGGYTITSTEGQAKIKSTAAELAETNMNGDLLYCYNGLVRVINTDLDTTSITTNANVGSAVYTTNYNGYIGAFSAENSTITGGKAKNDDVITNSPGATVTLKNVTVSGNIYNQASADIGGIMTITDSTINGKVYNQSRWNETNSAYTFANMTVADTTFTALVNNAGVASFTNCEIAELYHNATGANLTLTGTVKIPNMYTGHEDCTIDCSGLAADAQIVASKGKYKFADAAAAQAAVTNGVLKAAADYELNAVNETTYKIIERIVERTEYCVYGHENHEGIDCAEPILTWTKWEDTTKLPGTAGNYYLPANTAMELSGATSMTNASAELNINLDIRGNEVKAMGTNRIILFRASANSTYTITDTVGGGVLKSTQTTINNAAADGLIYAYNGTVRLINIGVDASSLQEADANHYAVYVARNADYEGHFVAENCTITGGDSKTDAAIFNSNYYDSTTSTNNGGFVTLKDTTVIGGFYQTVSAKNVVFAGNTKILTGTYNNYGVKGSNEAAVFTCTDLGANAQIVAFNCNYNFASADAAQAAITNGNIVPAAGRSLVVNGTKVQAVEAEITEYCINGHKNAAECQADGCTETIQTWTKLDTTITKLPKVAGYYYFPAGSTVELTEQENTDANSGDIFFDLRGATVKQTTANHRIMLVNGGANVTFLDTVGGGKLVNAAASMTTSGDGAVLYAHTGTLTVRDGITVDSTAILTNNEGKSGSALYVNTNGTLNLDGVTVKGGAATNGAIYHRGVALNMKDTTVETAITGKGNAVYTTKPASLDNCTINGEVYNHGAELTITNGTMESVLHNGGQATLMLKENVKIAHLELVNAEGWGKTDTLGTAAELTIANGSWGPFADLAAAQAAIDNGLLKPAAGSVLSAYVDGETGRVIANPVRCVYGHIAHEGETASCAEPIVEWTLWISSTTLPKTNGNYYVKDGKEITLTAQQGIVDEANVYEIRLDLRGGVVTQTNGGARLTLIKGGAGSKYEIVSTNGQAALKTDYAECTTDGALVYANICTYRLINVDLDSSSITSNTKDASAIKMLRGGSVILENCNVIGGKATGAAVTANHANEETSGVLVLKNSTITGGLYLSGSAAKLTLNGVVKLLPGVNAYGYKTGNAAAVVTCSGLAEGSEIVAENGNFSFKDAEAATAANGTILKPVSGKAITANNATLTVA